MITTAIGIIVSFFMAGATLHLFLLMAQLFFGHDGRQPFDNSSRLSVDRQKEQWWSFTY